MRPKVKAWDHGVHNLTTIAKWYLQWECAGLGILLQLEWQHLQSTVPGVSTLMGPIKDVLRDTFFTALFVG